ncbi:Glycosyltransferase sugar-binding region containing DXD motif-containing protein [Maribacter orientalis]|uniref:Glycosyltransferase sugar-binding region containing DXD motif-containing protein n=2 Tax=Maribacter orientalis TaxID=228957 RepID=A0A1H7WKR9_9FLAO|nr:Glycosyltransferase sugar-binding region containing DXD motif-containing protein [Maribacter orientalis]
MIPKIIHYCWLSGEEFPQEIKRNIASWKVLLPDYEFMLWDTKRFNLEEWPFAKEAFEKKKYAFASDIVRLYAVQQYGGIYLDTDVQILKKFDDLLQLPYFVGLEYENIIEAAIFGAEKNAEWVTYCLKHYDNRLFVKEDGTFDITIAPTILKKQIQKIKQIVSMTTAEAKDVKSLIKDDSKFYLFPCEFFSPKDVQTGKIHSTKNTYTIHHFNSSWLPYFSKLRRKIKLVLGVNTINKILKISLVSKTLKVFKKIEAKFDTK